MCSRRSSSDAASAMARMLAPRGKGDVQASDTGHVCELAGYHRGMADAASLPERLEQIGAQLDWVRDYL